MRERGRFGDYGGFYVPEILMPALEELEAAFRGAGFLRVQSGRCPGCRRIGWHDREEVTRWSGNVRSL